MGVVKMYISNKSAYAINSLTTTIENPAAPNLKIDTKNLPDSSVPAAGQTQQTIFCASHGPFSDAPTIRISYLAGALQAYTLQLPVLMHRYMEPSSLSAEDFFKRWRQIGGGPLEAQKTFGLSGKNKVTNEAYTRQMVEGFAWKILDGVDPNPKNIVGCGVFQFEGGKTGCLLRLEPNYEKSVCIHHILCCLSINANLVIDVPSYYPRHERRGAAGTGATDGAEAVSGNHQRCL
jgi:AP-2 complex subunit alpha